MELTHQLIPQLKQLRLSGILATLEARHRQAIDGKWSYIEFLERLLEDEVERRAQKQLALRLRRAALTTTKTLEGFDFSFNPSINRQQILALASGDYIRQKRNVLMCGPSGVGKPQPYNYLLQYERFPTLTSHATPCDAASASRSRA
jgi:DNA replication protein DnaC